MIRGWGFWLHDQLDVYFALHSFPQYFMLPFDEYDVENQEGDESRARLVISQAEVSIHKSQEYFLSTHFLSI